MLAAWMWAFVAFADQPVLIGTAVLAYSLGLRHAIDADHIAAIDNVTRKLMQEGKRPVAVGFFFALGHSSVVVLASLAVALTANALSDEARRLIARSAALSEHRRQRCSCSSSPIANLIVLRGVYRAFRLVAARRWHDGRGRSMRCFISAAGLRGCSGRCSGLFRRAGISIRSVCCSRLVSRPRARSACSACRRKHPMPSPTGRS